MLCSRRGQQEKAQHGFIELQLHAIEKTIIEMPLILSSYKEIDLKHLSHVALTVFEGKPRQLEQQLISYDVPIELSMHGCTALVMGKICRAADNDWSFHALGQVAKEKKFELNSRALCAENRSCSFLIKKSAQKRAVRCPLLSFCILNAHAVFSRTEYQDNVPWQAVN